MVLADLGKRLTSALSDLNRSSTVDESTVEATLKTIVTALLEADVNVKLVARLRNRIREKVHPLLSQGKLAEQPQRIKSLIQKTVYDELVFLVDPNSSSQSTTPPTKNDPSKEKDSVWKPRKGQTNVIMFVGLQGSGKTTSCTKLALHYQKRGYKTSLVCADTFRAGAFDQLRQNSVRAKIPFYGSYTETDPVVISSMGVEKFRQEKFDVVIVDTSGRHKQEQELFDEMKQISAHVKPNLTIMVLDASIGQAAESQSQAFKEAADFGAILVTKMDGHAKGGGAISAVAATKTPIMFIGTGEHFTDLERFDPASFISKLLGMGDMRGLIEHVQDMQRNQDPKRSQEMMKKLEAGIFTIRDLKEQLSQLMSMGPISKIAGMIPGMSDMLASAGGGADEAGVKMKRLLFIFDSMTAEELDSDGKIFEPKKSDASSNPSGKMPDGAARQPNPRILRVARGSGTSVQEVEELLSQHRMFGEMVKKAGGKQGWMAAAKKAQQAGGGRGRGGPMGGMPPGGMSQQQMQAMAKMLPPGMQQQLKSAGGMQAVQKMMEQMRGGGAGGGMPDFSQMMNMMGGGAGPGGR